MQQWKKVCPAMTRLCVRFDVFRCVLQGRASKDLGGILDDVTHENQVVIEIATKSVLTRRIYVWVLRNALRNLNNFLPIYTKQFTNWDDHYFSKEHRSWLAWICFRFSGSSEKSSHVQHSAEHNRDRRTCGLNRSSVHVRSNRVTFSSWNSWESWRIIFMWW